MSEIYKGQFNYLELIRNDSPSPPIIEYQVRCGEVETNVYDEPVHELIIDEENHDPTPEYQSLPVKDLIQTYEQGKFLCSSTNSKYFLIQWFGLIFQSHKSISKASYKT